MKKAICLLFAFFVISCITSAQEPYSVTHIYTLISDFYYLEISSDENYNLKIGMYGEKYVNGEYETLGDTLKLTSFNYTKEADNFSSTLKRILENVLSTYLVYDSLLIPLNFRESLPASVKMLRDSTIINAFEQSDGHVNYMLYLYSDSTFVYNTGADMGGTSTKGLWHEINNSIDLEPIDTNNCLQWICSKNKLRLFENYLIGVTFDETTKTTKYHYLRRLKPKD